MSGGGEVRWKPAAPGQPALELGAVRAWLFTDLHLGAQAPQEITSFAAALGQAPADLQALVVMGDLFDAFVGPEQWEEPAFQPLCAALSGLSGRGVRVILLRGNRDVLLEPADGARAGAEVADSVLLSTAGGRVLVTHGDQFCLRDRPYQRLRHWLRRRWLRALGRALPYSWRLALARRLRGVSRQAVARKPLDVLALVEPAVVEALEGHGAAAAVIGHLHIAEERLLAGGRRLRILPAWEPGRPALALTPAAQSLESPGFMSAAGPSQRTPVVTLDGLAGSGKSTLARRLAQRLGWAYLDSGAWYRALTWVVLARGADAAAENEVLDTLSRIELHCHADGRVIVDGRPLQAELRTARVDAAVVEVADHPRVRAALDERMRRLRSHAGVTGVVADGRDAGTVIFPDADLKVFVEASREERARRRAAQQRAAGLPVQEQAVLAALAERDARDASRGASAPRLSPGGRQLDNSKLSEEEAVERLLTWVAPLLHPPDAGARAADPTGGRAGPSH